MSFIIGADPGKTGAVALLDSDGELLEVNDMPTTGKFVSPHLLGGILAKYAKTSYGHAQSVTCVIEDVWSSPQMGVTSAFSFGRSKGVIEGIAAALAMRTEYVSPAKWKRDMKLGKDKGKARQLAIARWPEHASSFKRVKDDGRAEAALIGLWQVQHGE